MSSDLLPIQPFTRPARGSASLPGSKSLTNRALILAALGESPGTLTNALFSEDTDLMAAALNALGIAVTQDAEAKTMQVAGRGASFHLKSATLSVGLAGTAARFLTAFCAAAPEGVFHLDGIPQMRKRPMRGLIEALRALGAEIRCLGEEGYFPIEIRARGLRGGEVKIDASESSQMLSALLMVAPLAQSEVTVRLSAAVREPFVEMTVRLMQQFGVNASSGGGAYRIAQGQKYQLRDRAASCPIEPDATAAGYFFALPLVVGGALRLPGLVPAPRSLQGDLVFADVLKKAGLTVDVEADALSVSFAGGSPPRGITCDFSGFSDTFLTLAGIAPLLDGPTRITGIAHTRKQETDRVAGMARELKKLGQEVIETEDSLEIRPRPLPAGDSLIEIETYGDHRFAMSFGILGCRDARGDGRPWLAIRNPACVAKTFPHFFDLLASLRQRSMEG